MKTNTNRTSASCKLILKLVQNFEKERCESKLHLASQKQSYICTAHAWIHQYCRYVALNSLTLFLITWCWFLLHTVGFNFFKQVTESLNSPDFWTGWKWGFLGVYCSSLPLVAEFLVFFFLTAGIISVVPSDDFALIRGLREDCFVFLVLR